MINLNLYLAFFWALIGALVIGYHWSNRDMPGTIRIWGTEFSLGWVVVFFVVYNMIRWFRTRSAATAQQAMSALQAARRRRDRSERSDHRTTEPPDPNLDFSKPSDDPR